MGLVNKLSLLMAKMGCAGLRNASEEDKDNLRYVKAVVKAQGPRSFQFASDFIRSDAESLLEMVTVNSEILHFAKNKIYDRYVKDMVIEEKEVDKLIFAFKCLEKDTNSLLYFDKCLQKTVVQTLKTKECVEGEFAGKHCKIDLINLKQDENLNEVIEAIKIIDREEVL